MTSKPNTHADELRVLSDAAEKEAADIRYYSGGSPYNASEAKFHAALTNAFRTGQLVHVDEVAAKLSAYADEVEEYHSAGASYVRKAAKMFAQGEPNDGN